MDLYEAVQSGNLEEVRQQLAKGADVNKPDPQGRTPLHVAVEVGYPWLVKLLVDAGAVVNAADQEGLTPFHVAARKGHVSITPSLLAIDENAACLERVLKERAFAYLSGKGIIDIPPAYLWATGYFAELRSETGHVVERKDYDDKGRLMGLIRYCYEGANLVRTEFYDVALRSYRARNPSTGVNEEFGPDGVRKRICLLKE